jgi:TupA-like ATPgrasp
MIEGAEALAHDIDFVRVDLYDLGGKPRFGEMSFYPGSGLDPFDPISLDAMLGRCWLDPGVTGRATVADRSSGDE